MKGSRLCTLIVLIVCSQVSASDLAQPVFQLQPVLVDSDQQVLGIFTGPAISHDTTGTRVKAYGLLSPKGYMASLLPNGELGGVKSIYFQEKDCKGQPGILAENPLDVSESYLPGFVFTFGQSIGAYSIPREARSFPVDLKSRLVVENQITSCKDLRLHANLYPAKQNDAIKTGIPDEGYSAAFVKVLSINDEKLKRKSIYPQFSTPDGRTKPAIDFSLPLNVCSPGCDNDMISNGYCEPECNNKACGYDANDCSVSEIENAIKKEEAQCAPLCELDDLGDGYCDRACNNSACGFDKGDCRLE